MHVFAAAFIPFYGVVIVQRRSSGEYLFLFALVVAAITAAVLLSLQVMKVFDTSGSNGTLEGDYILIDPGHGGRDGGASAADGTLEKDINLVISLSLYDLLRFVGYRAEITRDSDRMTCDAGLKTLREQKVSDMKNRLILFDKSRLAISVHQNHFEQPQYWGTQIWYSTNHPESKMLGASVRQTVLEMLQPDNKRELKKSTGDIYLLSRTTTAAIIVECGFLSNPAELSKLKDETYQRKLAFAIACGVIAYNP